MHQLIFIPEERLEQGSELWKQRRQIVGTATQSPCVMGDPLPYKDSVKTWLQLRSERAFGSTFQGNLDSERGKRLEPLALELFNSEMAGTIEPMIPIWCERSLTEVDLLTGTEFAGATIVHWSPDLDEPLPPIFGPTMASSYDGYSRNGDFHAWVEIKCPRDKRSKTWKSVEKGRIPDDYYWQVVHQRATFGDHDAFGYFMVYLDDKMFLIMSIEEDERFKSGQFARDVDRVSQEWIKFLSGEPQPGDMTPNAEWVKWEQDLIANRDKRMEVELQAKPWGDAEERAKGKLKDLVLADPTTPGLPHIYGRSVGFDNRPTRSFDMDAFKKANPEFDLSPYTTIPEPQPIVDVDRLMNQFPEFVSVKDSWRVSVSL